MGSPQLLGIVNITDDSFSDGGRFLDPQVAVSHADSLLEAAPAKIIGQHWGILRTAPRAHLPPAQIAE
jgi:dihydropteroate synthase